MQPSTGTNQGAITAISQSVAAVLGGAYDTASIQVFGTYTGVLTVQVTVDGVNWVSLTGATSLTNAASGAQSATIASAAQGVWQVDISGFAGVQVIALAAVTGSAAVSINAGNGSGIVGIDTPVVIGAGSAAIGTIGTPTGSMISVVSAATTNASVQKATSGNLFEISVSNPTATPVYVKLYNKASAPTVGTDVPVLTLVAPATSATATPSVNSLPFGQIGKRFTTGIAMAITAGPLATDVAVAVAGVQVHGTYI